MVNRDSPKQLRESPDSTSTSLVSTAQTATEQTYTPPTTLDPRFFQPFGNGKFDYLEEPGYYLDEALLQTKSEDVQVVREVVAHASSAPPMRSRYWRLPFCKSNWRFLVAVLVVTTVFAAACAYAITASIMLNNPMRNGHRLEKLTNRTYTQLKAIRTNLVDPDSPVSPAKSSWTLVFSDEFNVENRTFAEYEDQFFTAVDLYYQATQDLEYYSPSMVTTRDGCLEITFDKHKVGQQSYVSGMVQSWNKLCFNKQARVEISVQMPRSVENGLWPAVWSLGNLARPGYLASSDGVWPYTYDECDVGILPNQSTANSGMSYLPGQRLSSCTCFGEDHPSLGVGRGAPEIDIVEGLYHGNKYWGVQTVQVAPFDEWWRPDYRFVDIANVNNTMVRQDVGTVYQESISLETPVEIDGFIRFAMEYDTKGGGYVRFAINDVETFTLKGEALHGNQWIGHRQISREPMSLIFNMGLSRVWNPALSLRRLDLPAKFLVDYVRVYQPRDQVSLTCDPEDYPTSQYIRDHMRAYVDSSLHDWKGAGFAFPRNSIADSCPCPGRVFSRNWE
ncbi:uncharacterized protein LODBEIA_P57300 [Lodderomyces beijingensis]|uniref:GH16 domain-containing protein n=1 Tax=Lodderomyces beijingensis TaxID=1775926 RepID=A0ABP0ZNU8_9ASCO